MKRRILIVDDDMAVLLTLKAVLELQGFHVETASSTTEALQKMQNGVFQMVITDVRMESEDAGFEVVRAARLQSYDPATAMLTAYPRCAYTGAHPGPHWPRGFVHWALIHTFVPGDSSRTPRPLKIVAAEPAIHIAHFAREK